MWSRNGNTAYKVARAIQAGRVFVNCYHAYPAHAAFGGYKHSGIGRDSYKMMLSHYQNVKNVMTSYGTKAYGFSSHGPPAVSRVTPVAIELYPHCSATCTAR